MGSLRTAATTPGLRLPPVPERDGEGCRVGEPDCFRFPPTCHALPQGPIESVPLLETRSISASVALRRGRHLRDASRTVTDRRCRATTIGETSGSLPSGREELSVPARGAPSKRRSHNCSLVSPDCRLWGQGAGGVCAWPYSSSPHHLACRYQTVPSAPPSPLQIFEGSSGAARSGWGFLRRRCAFC